MDTDGILERIFVVASVWTLTATIPVSLIWGETVWMVIFVGAMLTASLAFPGRISELLNRFEHPIGYLERNFKNDLTGWSYSKSKIAMIYHLRFFQKYHYLILVITIFHFLISGALGENELAAAYLIIMAAFSAILAIVAGLYKGK